MLIKILLGLGLLLVVLVVMIMRQPDEFRVSRSLVMNAAPNVIFDQVNATQKWQSWSPWVKLDPHATFTYSGPESGIGSSTHWSGNNDIGEGTSTITDSTPHTRILFRLEFMRPMQGVNTTEFTFTPEGNGTRVTWTMTGQNNFIGKAIGLVMNCEKMVGAQFDEGLNNLKTIVEKQA